MKLLLSAGLTLFIILFSAGPVFSDQPIENIKDHQVKKPKDPGLCENNKKVILKIRNTNIEETIIRLIDVCEISHLEQSYRMVMENDEEVSYYSQLSIYMNSGDRITTLSSHVEVLTAMGQIAE